ncbi:hypothetical protein TL16_g04726 [Triparma laevis f. inornata]|uniref:Uncharacterized protein n=1 Tax=Triparma laevis f. inornata TaxID=1714386 RepID=A0A9W7AH21_9STRA|nr:hypothetical protein TL16_g04726 [Triparma laevis f. inornata]
MPPRGTCSGKHGDLCFRTLIHFHQHSQEKMISQLQAKLKEKADLISKLYLERESERSKLHQKREEERKKYVQVMSDLSKFKRSAMDTPQTANTAAQPLDPDDDRVKRKGDVLSKSTTITSCSFSIKIHEEMEAIRDAILGDHLNVNSKLLYQEVLEDVMYWRFMADNIKCCHLVLKLFIESQDVDEIRIRVASASVESPSLPTPHSFAKKSFRLLLNNGTIILRPLRFGHSSFTFKADAAARRLQNLGGKILNHLAESPDNNQGIKVDDAFCKIADLFYERFKKEDTIDARRKEKIAGTANESVEKFVYHSGEGGAGVGMTVAKVDVSAASLFAELWLLDTYARKAAGKDTKIREVWNNVDGTRGLKYTTSVALPGGFQARVFEERIYTIVLYICVYSNTSSLYQTWMTWEEKIDEEGRHTFIIAWAPFETYEGTYHEVAWAKKMHEATSRGVHIVKELTENTCEWTRAQQADLKFSSAMPVSLLDRVAKKELAWANEYQEKFRRNGKEVDGERVAALAGKMIARREKPLMNDQVAVFASCQELLGGEGEEGWKVLGSTSKEVEMSMKYFPPEKGERSIGTGKSVGIVDCSAEEVAAWVMDYCNNERVRISKEEGNPARLELRAKARVNEFTAATVKKMSFFLDNREFVARMIWKSEEGKVLIAYESIDGEVDYGVKLKKTRALTRGLWQIEDLPVRGGAKQCRVTLVLQFDAGGVIPTWVVDKTFPRQLSVIQKAIDEFRQDEKVDATDRKEKATLMKERWRGEMYSEEENALLERAHQKFEGAFKEGKGVIYCQQVDLKGFIPNFVVNSKTVLALGYLSLMRKKFDKSLEIDAGRRAEIVKKFKLEDESGGTEALAQFEALFEEREGWKRPSRSFGKADSKVQVNAVSGKAWGSTSVHVRAELEEAAAFFWDFGSRVNMEISGDVERTFEENENYDEETHKKIVMRRQHLESRHGVHHRDRIFNSEIVLRSLHDHEGGIVLVFSPLGEVTRARGSVAGESDGSVEASETVVIRLKKLSGKLTKVYYAFDIELGFGISHVASIGLIERRLEEILEISIYFQRLVPLNEFSDDDGQALGFDLLWKAEHSKLRVKRLNEVVEKSKALQELCLKYSWMKTMMAAALEGSLKSNRKVGTKLVCVSENEAAQIGRNLVPSLMTEQLAAAGVNEWRVQNRAVKELMEEQVWFEPMAVVLGKGIVKAAAWGLMARVVVGAVLSVADLLTDLVVLHQFGNGGEDFEGYKDAQLASLVTCVAIQLAGVLVQNRKKGVVRILKEMAVVVIGMKAPLDAYRVASGAEQEKDTEFDPMSEMMCNKCVEMFAESIPGIIIQTSAILSTMNAGDEVFKRSYEETFAIGFQSMAGATGLGVSFLTRLVVKFIVDFTGCIQFRHPYEIGGLYFTLNLFLPLIGLAAMLQDC